jgi:hypothetical protein
VSEHPLGPDLGSPCWDLGARDSVWDFELAGVRTFQGFVWDLEPAAATGVNRDLESPEEDFNRDLELPEEDLVNRD